MRSLLSIAVAFQIALHPERRLVIVHHGSIMYAVGLVDWMFLASIFQDAMCLKEKGLLGPCDLAAPYLTDSTSRHCVTGTKACRETSAVCMGICEFRQLLLLGGPWLLGIHTHKLTLDEATCHGRESEAFPEAQPAPLT